MPKKKKTPHRKLQFRNVKTANHLSEETLAFTATLYFNGKPFAHCRNDGNGGSNMYNGDPRRPDKDGNFWEALKAVEAVAIETIADFYPTTTEPLDLWISFEIERIQLEKALKRGIGKNRIALLDEDGDITLSPPLPEHLTEKAIPLFKMKYPKMTILNGWDLYEASFEAIKRAWKVEFEKVAHYYA